MNRRDLLTKSGAAALIVTSTGLSLPARAGTVAGFGGSTEITQILNNVQLLGAGIQQGLTAARTLQGVVQRALQIQQQFQQLQTMLRNIETLPQRIWRDIEQDFLTLKSGYDTSLGLSWTRADIDDAIRDRFTPFEQYEANPLNTQQFAAKYRTITRDTQVTAADILEAANSSVETIEAETRAFKRLQAQSNSEEGQSKLLQIGHDIAAMQYNNGIQLRNLMADNNKAMVAFESHALEIENAERAQRDRFFTDRVDGTSTLPASGTP